jgi:RHS repeat-associated protein
VSVTNYDNNDNTIKSQGRKYRYAGEQWDADLGLYYNRTRYLDVERGRFWTSDSFEGEIEEPISLHKYLYGNANPVGNVDPSGNASIQEVSTVFAVIDILSTIQSTISFLKQPDLASGAFLAVGLIGLPGVGEGLKALRLSGRLPLLGKIVQALRFPGPPQNAVESSYEKGGGNFTNSRGCSGRK